MSGNRACIITRCIRPAGPRRGLCLVCYSKAKAEVDAGRLSWQKLEALGLALPEGDPFEAELKAKLAEEKDREEN